MKICEEATTEGVERALRELPLDLDGMYSEVLQGVRTRYQRAPRTIAMAENALRWVLCAVRPLNSTELVEGILIMPGESSERLISNSLTIQAVLDICQPLLVLDSGLQVVRFSHFSVQEFLSNRFVEKAAHTLVAEACLTLLVNPDPLAMSVAKPQSRGVLVYATFNWGDHVRLSGAGSDLLTNLWKQFLSPSPAYQVWVSNVSSMVGPLRPPSSGPLAPLLVACFYRLVDICGILLRSTTEYNSTNADGHTSLHIATLIQSVGIVRLLIETKEIDLGQEDWRGRSALHLAVMHSDVEITQMLLNKGADVNAADKSGTTPLSTAVSLGNLRTVEMLLDKGADTHAADNKGRTPLTIAVAEGYESIAEMVRGN